jgi:hypothetical protein
MHSRGVRGSGEHLSRVEWRKEVLWGRQTLERSAREKKQIVNSSVQARVLRGLGQDARAMGGGKGKDRG